jgi:hypothetical protein
VNALYEDDDTKEVMGVVISVDEKNHDFKEFWTTVQTIAKDGDCPKGLSDLLINDFGAITINEAFLVRNFLQDLGMRHPVQLSMAYAWGN